MIEYESGGIYFLLNVFKVNGSVFPKALQFSLPCAFITGVFVLCVHDFKLRGFNHFKDPESVMNNNAVWGGFSFLVGFLVVFRTSQAYARFWEGCTSTHKMGAEWFDCCSALMSFCKYSLEEKELILSFQNTLVRLFSMLHAAALGEIEDCAESEHYSGVEAFKMELIDAEAIDKESLRAIRDSDAKVELIFQWIQQLVVEHIRTGVLSIPPPILTRSFQEIASGMVHFHDAMKISNVPFPFPYAQTCDCLLLLHWLMVPFVVSQWVTTAWWAAMFSFIQVFTLWTLNLIAIELENPFGTDPNDIDGGQMQLVMNNHLRLLMRESTMQTPKLDFSKDEDQWALVRNIVNPERSEVRSCSFNQIWTSMEDTPESAVLTRRFKSQKSKRSINMHEDRRANGLGNRLSSLGGSAKYDSSTSSLQKNCTIQGRADSLETLSRNFSGTQSSIGGSQSISPSMPGRQVFFQAGMGGSGLGSPRRLSVVGEDGQLQARLQEIFTDMDGWQTLQPDIRKLQEEAVRAEANACARWRVPPSGSVDGGGSAEQATTNSSSTPIPDLATSRQVIGTPSHLLPQPIGSPRHNGSSAYESLAHSSAASKHGVPPRMPEDASYHREPP